MRDAPTIPPSPPVSRLAITALVLAVIPLCPPVNLSGAFVGLVAARRIRLAPQRLGGRRIAWAAVLAGWLSSILWSGGWWWVATAVRDRVQTSMESAVVATCLEGTTRPESVRGRHWGPASAPSVDALRDFAAALEQRYGPVERVAVTSLTAGGTTTRPSYTAALTLHFARRTQRLGSARYEAVPGSIRVRLTRLAVVDAEMGDLVLGGTGSDGGGGSSP